MATEAPTIPAPPTDDGGFLSNIQKLTQSAFEEPPAAAPPKAPDEPPRQEPAGAGGGAGTTAPARTETAKTPADSSPAQPEDTEEESRESIAADPKAKLDWTKANQRRKQLKGELKQAQAELAELRSKPVPSTVDISQIEALKKEKAELEAALERVAIEHSPRFKNWYLNETEPLINVAKSTAGPHADKVEKILKMPPSDARMAALDALKDQLTESQVAYIANSLVGLDKVNWQRDQLINSRRDAWLAEERQRVENERIAGETRKKEWTKAFEEEMASAQEHLEIYQEKKDDAKWNASVRDQISLARRMFNGDDMTPSDLAKTALWAAAGPGFVSRIDALQKENELLMKELEKIRGNGASPAPGSAKESEGVDVANMGAIDYVLHQAKQSGLLH